MALNASSKKKTKQLIKHKQMNTHDSKILDTQRHGYLAANLTAKSARCAKISQSEILRRLCELSVLCG